jgi:hypothetical protein
MNFITVRIFCFAEDTIKRKIRPATDRQDLSAICISDNGLVSRIYKYPLTLNKNKMKNPSCKTWKSHTDILPKEFCKLVGCGGVCL